MEEGQAVQDCLSSLFLHGLDCPDLALPRAFGLTAAHHPALVVAKLELLLAPATSRRPTAFFGLLRHQSASCYEGKVSHGMILRAPRLNTTSYWGLRDRAGEENRAREVAAVVRGAGQTAAHAPAPALVSHAPALLSVFLLPHLQDWRGSDAVRDAALVGLADATTALQQLDEPQGETILKQIFLMP